MEHAYFVLPLAAFASLTTANSRQTLSVSVFSGEEAPLGDSFHRNQSFGANRGYVH
ncbi:hypothetical protein F442_22873 [Phytophthora nicotianae P10297]|uniref:Uncharacterized protein n=1 Tax=Phytophthora nicotianae P10297 TaxID=1317064 RepID=W2XZB9_PHYNI|nr:hypothetical protein F442_22873 [Phytophthora nicotianae P10297]